MTRTFLSVLGIGVLCGGGFLATRLLPEKQDMSALQRQVESLSSELAEMRGTVGQRDPALSAAGARLGAAVFQSAPKPKETVAEEEARVERENASRVEREAIYYDQLDQEIKGSGSSAHSEGQVVLRKNLEALATAKIEPSPLVIGPMTCSATMCRLELQKDPRGGAGLSTALRHLIRGFGEVTMRPFDASNKTVLYAVTGKNRLPTMPL
jgi:hypothetical protein